MNTNTAAEVIVPIVLRSSLLHVAMMLCKERFTLSYDQIVAIWKKTPIRNNFDWPVFLNFLIGPLKLMIDWPGVPKRILTVSHALCVFLRIPSAHLI